MNTTYAMFSFILLTLSRYVSFFSHIRARTPFSLPEARTPLRLRLMGPVLPTIIFLTFITVLGPVLPSLGSVVPMH
jgi:hypothetical protein